MGVQLRLLQLSLLSGFFLSAYVEMIKIEFEKNPDYVPQCDISEEVSCSKVLHSEYGHMLSALKLIDKDSLLNQTNAFYGAIFYISSWILSLFKDPAAIRLLYGMSVLSLLITVSLAYVMKVLIGSTCLVCLATYVCNVTFFICARGEVNKLSSEKLGKKDKKKA